MATGKSMIAAFALALLAGGLPPAQADQPDKLTPAEFEKLHKEFRMPDRGMWAIPWKLSVQDARELAAKTRKPLLIWMQDGSPLGCT